MILKRIHFVSAPFVHGFAVEQDFPFPRLRLRVDAVEENRCGGQRSKNNRENQSGLNAHNLTSFESCIGCHDGRSSMRTNGSLSETPSSKHQAPEKSRNRNTKYQAPNTKELRSPSAKHRHALATRVLAPPCFW